MIWSCLSCHHTVAIEAPEKSRHRCPLCTAALVPLSVLRPDNMMDDFENIRMWRRYCVCANAYTCQRNGQYQPSCEDLTMTPGCLVSLFAEIRDLRNSLDNAGKAGDSQNRQ